MKAPWVVVAGQQTLSWSAPADGGIQQKFLLYVPPGYDAHASEKWPLIVFLHGSGERGNDIEWVKKNGPPKLLEAQGTLPFVVASPQLATGQVWNSAQLSALVDALLENMNIDVDRIYLTGLSLGGHGTWRMAQNFPDRFAAIAPVCGVGDVKSACLIKNIPVWAFHGDADTVVPLQGQSDMVDAVNACGGNAKLTVYPGVGHDSWTATYANPELYTWLLQHRRTKSTP